MIKVSLAEAGFIPGAWALVPGNRHKIVLLNTGHSKNPSNI